MWKLCLVTHGAVYAWKDSMSTEAERVEAHCHRQGIPMYKGSSLLMEPHPIKEPNPTHCHHHQEWGNDPKGGYVKQHIELPEPHSWQHTNSWQDHKDLMGVHNEASQCHTSRREELGQVIPLQDQKLNCNGIELQVQQNGYNPPTPSPKRRFPNIYLGSCKCMGPNPNTAAAGLPCSSISKQRQGAVWGWVRALKAYEYYSARTGTVSLVMNDPEIEFLYVLSVTLLDWWFPWTSSIELEQSLGLNPKPFQLAVCLLASGLTYKVQSPACSKEELVSTASA